MTEDELEGIGSIAVDSQGKIFVCYYGDRSIPGTIAVYDNNGKRKREDEEKINTLLKQLTVTNSKIESSVSLLACNSLGYIHLSARPRFYTIDPQLTEIKEFCTFPYKNGERYSFRFLNSGKRAKEFALLIDGSIRTAEVPFDILAPVEIIIFNKKGSFSKKLILPRQAKFSDIEKLFPIGIGDLYNDEKDHFYMIREPLISEQISLGQNDTVDFYVWGPTAIMEYNGTGEFMGIRAVLYVPRFGTSFHRFSIDSAGNVYYLDFKSDHVDVMMA
ncbi:MAG: hypothetical protein ACP5JO_07005, partial [Candidatus Ratteibacteria bacterium]